MNRSTSRSRTIVPSTRDPGPMTMRGLRLFSLPQLQPLGFSTTISPLTTAASARLISPLTVDTLPPISAPFSSISPFTLPTLSLTLAPCSRVMRPFTASTSPSTIDASPTRIPPFTVLRSSDLMLSASLTPPLTVLAFWMLAPWSTRMVPFTVFRLPVTVAASPTEMLPLTEEAPPDSVPAGTFTLLLIDAPNAGTDISKTSNPIVNAVFVTNLAIFSIPLGSFPAY